MNALEIIDNFPPSKHRSARIRKKLIKRLGQTHKRVMLSLPTKVVEKLKAVAEGK